MRHLLCLASSAVCLIFIWPSTTTRAQSTHPMTFDDMISMSRVSDPQVSPDGKWVAYSVAKPDLDANHILHNIWLVSTTGGEPRQVTQGGSDERPRWSPDGQSIAFISSRDNAGQVYILSLTGGEARRVTSLSTGADNEIWSPDGKSIAFISSVYPDCPDDACNAKRDDEKSKSKVKARIYTKLMVRHWTSWWDGKRSHLFIVPVSGGAPKDLTPKADYDVPPFNLGNPEAISFSPDSKEIAFTANTDDATSAEATSTNGDIFTVPADGSAPSKRITDNPGDDWGPIYSKDGKWIAYVAQLQPGYEADRWRLMLYDRASGKHTNLTENLDRSIGAFEWAPDSKTIYFSAEDQGEGPIYAMSATAGSTPRKIISEGFNPEFDLSADGNTLVFTRQGFTAPSEVFSAHADGSNTQQITHHNSEILAGLTPVKWESFWFNGTDGVKVNAFLVTPPNFDSSKKYPLLVLVHGGPQDAWDDSWSYRWNQRLMVSPGYVALIVNFRGSSGYGAKFEEEISKDWGGQPYRDVMGGIDAAIAKYPFIDKNLVAAAGGSYGGFMIDWLATHTGRFKCLISHAGPFDTLSMYATEELWFADWEFNGPPWVHPELFQKWSSVTDAGNLGKFKTPTLVIGGEMDFRVPYTQDLEFFSALQRQGVPSKLIIYPDEGHWVLKPQNSQLWYKTFFDWLATYVK